MKAALWVAKEFGDKKNKIGEKKQPQWKRRIEIDITNLRRDITDWKGEDEEKLEGKERKRLRN